MLHSVLCSIVIRDYIAIRDMSFGIMSHSALCRIWTYVVRDFVIRRNVVRINVVWRNVVWLNGVRRNVSRRNIVWGNVCQHNVTWRNAVQPTGGVSPRWVLQ